MYDGLEKFPLNFYKKFTDIDALVYWYRCLSLKAR